VAVGGAFGAVSRYGISEWARTRFGESFPWGTLLVNVAGSLLLGVLLGLALVGDMPRSVKAAAGAGFMGAFTTFSTFSCETVLLAQDGKFDRALINVVANVVLGITAAVIGFWMARSFAT
jgi:CrcB protein